MQVLLSIWGECEDPSIHDHVKELLNWSQEVDVNCPIWQGHLQSRNPGGGPNLLSKNASLKSQTCWRRTTMFQKFHRKFGADPTGILVMNL